MSSPPPSGPLLELDTDFAHALVPEQNDLDTSFLAAEATLELETVPSALRPGAHILLHDEEGRVPGFVTRILALDDRTLVLDPPLPPDHGFRAGTTSIRGNLALAGHGAARPQVILGSGDATRSAQSFVLDEPALSFVPDPGQPRGVRPDVEVTVGRQIWSQVPNFRDSEPTAPHFTTSMTEGGGVRFTFGDGEHGRRLPSGRDNVRVRYRSGNGAAGNLDAGSASKTTRPHPLVAAVHQPLDAAGGNAMEPVESLRSNAPASVLTLGRAVSLRDFEYLAAGQAGLWQARAFVLPTGPRWRETVEVVVVPAGGRPLDPIRRRSLAQTLEQHALPGVGVEITPFVSRPLHLDICLCVRTSEYSPTEVEARVRGALAEAFSLRRRRLGQDVFASQVIQVVEGIEGVESSRCLLALPSGEEGDDIVFDPTLRRLRIDGRAVCHLDHPLATSNVRTEEPAS